MSVIEMMCVAVEVVDDIVDLTHYSVSGLGCMVSLSSRREGPALGGRKMCSKTPENKNNNDLYRPWKKLGNEESLPRIVFFLWLILLLTPLTSLWLIFCFASFLKESPSSSQQ